MLFFGLFFDKLFVGVNFCYVVLEIFIVNILLLDIGVESVGRECNVLVFNLFLFKFVLDIRCKKSL